MTILALPEASLHYVEMKQPDKKPAVPGCSNWISLELRLPGYLDDPRRVVLAANRPEDYYYYKRILLQWRGVKKTPRALNNNKNKTNDSLLLAMLARVL